jgi:D-aminoacyl-tRNA deacylase
MKVVLQRVKNAHVEVAGVTVGAIGPGLVLLLGVARTDTRKDADYLVDKTLHLRIFPDEAGRMNRSIIETGGALLVVSQFTLYGDCKKGRRPSFDEAAPGEQARELYEYFVSHLKFSNISSNIIVETGVFQAEMEVHLVNDGPVTIILESKGNSREPIVER